MANGFWARLVSGFVHRDIFYALGGTLVLRATPPIRNLEMEGFVSILVLALVAYAIGYVLQEILSMFKFVSSNYSPPSRFILFFASCFAPRENWNILRENTATLGELRYFWSTEMPEGVANVVSRTIDLKHIGTALAPSFLVSGGLQIVLQDNSLLNGVSAACMGVTCVALSLLFALISKVKNAQQWLIIIEAFEHRSTTSARSSFESV